MRLSVDRVLKGSEFFASPGVAYIKWPNPVRPGDSLTLRAEVIEIRRSKSQPDLGILRWRWRMFNQHRQEVLESEATSLFDLSPRLRCMIMQYPQSFGQATGMKIHTCA